MSLESRFESEMDIFNKLGWIRDDFDKALMALHVPPRSSYKDFTIETIAAYLKNSKDNLHLAPVRSRFIGALANVVFGGPEHANEALAMIPQFGEVRIYRDSQCPHVPVLEHLGFSDDQIWDKKERYIFDEEILTKKEKEKKFLLEQMTYAEGDCTHEFHINHNTQFYRNLVKNPAKRWYGVAGVLIGIGRNNWRTGSRQEQTLQRIARPLLKRAGMTLPAVSDEVLCARLKTNPAGLDLSSEDPYSLKELHLLYNRLQNLTFKVGTCFENDDGYMLRKPQLPLLLDRKEFTNNVLPNLVDEEHVKFLDDEVQHLPTSQNALELFATPEFWLRHKRTVNRRNPVRSIMKDAAEIYPFEFLVTALEHDQSEVVLGNMFDRNGGLKQFAEPPAKTFKDAERYEKRKESFLNSLTIKPTQSYRLMRKIIANKGISTIMDRQRETYGFTIPAHNDLESLAAQTAGLATQLQLRGIIPKKDYFLFKEEVSRTLKKIANQRANLDRITDDTHHPDLTKRNYEKDTSALTGRLYSQISKLKTKVISERNSVLKSWVRGIENGEWDKVVKQRKISNAPSVATYEKPVSVLLRLKESKERREEAKSRGAQSNPELPASCYYTLTQIIADEIKGTQSIKEHRTNAAYRESLSKKFDLTSWDKFTRTYDGSTISDTREERAVYHTQHVLDILATKNIPFKEFKLHTKKTLTLFNEGDQEELKRHYNARRELALNQSPTHFDTLRVELDANPFSRLGVGERVHNSCYNSRGVNYWNAVPIAADENKRVLWVYGKEAPDEEEKLIARKVIAITTDNKLRQGVTHYTGDFDVEYQLEKTMYELGQQMGMNLTDSGTIDSLLTTEWSDDNGRRELKFKYVPFETTPQKKVEKRTLVAS